MKAWPCVTCLGTGYYLSADPFDRPRDVCPHCNGLGVVFEFEDDE